MGLLDVIWSRQANITFSGWPHPAVAVSACILISLFYRKLRYAPSLAEVGAYAALWIAFTTAGSALTYLTASLSRPLADVALSALDARLGFDWVAWNGFIHKYHKLTIILRMAYSSLLIQVAGSILFFALTRCCGRNAELLLNAVLALILTSIVAAVWPTLGPWVHFAYNTLPSDTLYVADILTLRSHVGATFSLARMQGIVSFPSYHTVLAILLMYGHRCLPSLRLVLVVNGLMLLSIPSEGGHYLVDMFAGSGIAVAAILAARLIAYKKPGSPTSSQHFPSVAAPYAPGTAGGPTK
jgi:hypothetical protein